VCRDLKGLTDHSRRPRPGIAPLIISRCAMTRLHWRCAIAMAQLGDFAGARLLLQRAAAVGPREEIARARCVTVRRVDPQSGEVLRLIGLKSNGGDSSSATAAPAEW
jgi:hypothetical protein